MNLTVLRLIGFLVMLLVAPASAMAQVTMSPAPLNESETDAILEDSDQSSLTSGGAAIEPQLLKPASTLAEAPPGNDNLDSVLATSEVVAEAAGATESTWVADSLTWLDQAVAAQASLPASGTEADSLALQPSSTNSRDLQPMESPSAREDLLQTPLAQSSNLAQTTSTPAQSEQWHFLFVPYIYVPLFISGSADYKGTENFRNNFSPGGFDPAGDPNASRDFEFTPSQVRTAIKDSLNFAAFGGLEAWSPSYNLGVLANVDYLSVSSGDTFTRPVRRPGFADFIPTELNSALNTQLWNADLAASYRFYDAAKASPEGLDTEFDLGPFVFDVLGGVNLTSINSQLGLSTNLGGDGQFTTSNTVISPLLGGRFRWNANPRLAVLASGSVSGFGIGGLMKYSFQGGVDWLFSGNTSLGLGYRLGFLDYNSSDVDLNVDQNGPYLNFGFRF